MKILVTGSRGQLGSELRELASGYPGYEFTWIDIEELDLSLPENVDHYFSSRSFEAIINCAAYTAVDKAEKEQDLARKLNADLPGQLARIAGNMNAFLVHISTDYIFDGNNYRPYGEDDRPNPVSAYGRSKYAGELGITAQTRNCMIIRTSWLYSGYGKNFVKTILEKARERGNLRVVYDQTGCPTYARDLAKTILDILPAATALGGINVFHYSNEGVISWYDFAKAIIEIAGISCRVEPIESWDFPTPAVRPFYSAFNKSRIKEKFKIEIPYWRDSLRECIEKITNFKLRITN